MNLLAKAAEYIFGIITDNEEVKKFPKDFVTASAQWMRSWLLIDDPTVDKTVQSDNVSEKEQREIVDEKLKKLKGDGKFIGELTVRLDEYERQKNIVKESTFSAGGNIHVGDIINHNYPAHETPKTETPEMENGTGNGDAQSPKSELEAFKAHLLYLLNEDLNATIADILELIKNSRYTAAKFKEVYTMRVDNPYRKEEVQLSVFGYDGQPYVSLPCNGVSDTLSSELQSPPSSAHG